MFLFLAVFLSVYALLNLYVYRWLKPAFGWRRRGTLGFVLFVVAITALSFAVHPLDRADHFDVARACGLVAYTWMLWVMWIVCFGFLVELWNAGVGIVAWRRPAAAAARVSARHAMQGIAATGVLLMLWGGVEAQHLTMDTIMIRTARLPPGTPPITLVHVTDVHFGLLIGQHALVDRMKRLIAEAHPDVLLSTGDMIDSTSTPMKALADAVATIQPPLGKFAVLGNHEFYTGVDESVALMKRAGFRVLREDGVLLPHAGTNILVVGVDDPAGRGMGMTCHPDPAKALPPAGATRPFTVLLVHQPVVFDSVLGRADLQLSGHVHGGQVFPFQLFVRLAYRHFTGLHDIGSGTQLYVSPGAGTWGPPIRVFAPPRITRIIVEPGG